MWEVMQCSVYRGSWRCRRSCSVLYIGGHGNVGGHAVFCM